MLSCLTLAAQCDGWEVTTIEGLAPEGELQATGFVAGTTPSIVVFPWQNTKLSKSRLATRHPVRLPPSRAGEHEAANTVHGGRNTSPGRRNTMFRTQKTVFWTRKTLHGSRNTVFRTACTVLFCRGAGARPYQSKTPDDR